MKMQAEMLRRQKRHYEEWRLYQNHEGELDEISEEAPKLKVSKEDMMEAMDQGEVRFPSLGNPKVPQEVFERF